jgi:hypothetical protein
MCRCLTLLAGALGVVVILAATAPDAAAQKKKKKTTTDDIGVVNPIGRPDFDAGQTARIALWVDGDVWNLRVTSPKETRATFNGRIETKEGTVVGAFESLEKAKKALKADWVTPLPRNRGFEFHINTTGKVDGFAFKASKDTKDLYFQLRVNQSDDPKRIFIGAAGRHPEKANFILPAHPGQE